MRFTAHAAWTAPSNVGRPEITSYTYQISTDPPNDTVATVENDTKTNVDLDELANGTTYNIRVTATNDEGTSEPSDWRNFTTLADHPPTFSNATASRSINENNAVGDNVGNAIVATDTDGDTITYEITGTNTGGFTIDPVSHKLKAGQVYNHEEKDKYTITVTATESTLDKQTTQTVNINIGNVSEPPAAPELPTTTHQAQTALSYSWITPANTGPPIERYQHRSKKTGSVWTLSANLSASTTTADFTGLDEGEEYRFEVRAINAEGDGAWSDTNITRTNDNNIPVIGTGLSEATRRFDENTTSVNNLGDAFVVEDTDIADGGQFTWQITTSGVPFQLSSTSSASVYIQTQANQTYDYETTPSYSVNLKVQDGQGGSDSVIVTISVTNLTEAPGKPDQPAYTSRSLDSITIQWNEPTNTGPAIDDYNIQYRETGTTWINPDHTGTTRTFTADSLQRGTTYEFQVQAHSPEGNSSWSTSLTVSTLDNSAPILNTSSTLTITKPENTPPGSEFYQFTATDPDPDTIIFEITGSDHELFDISTTGKLTSRSTTHFDYERAKHAYTLTVTAADGFDDDSTAVTVNITDVTEKPGKPNIPDISSLSSTGLTATWTAPTNTGPDIYEYESAYSTNSTSHANVIKHDDLIRSRELAGLIPGSIYWISVRAHNDEGWSEWSNHANATTQPNTPPTFNNTTDPVTRNINENTVANTNVGAAISATDNETASLTYSLTGTDANSFTIVATSGQVKTKAGVDYNFEATQNTYTFQVVVIDLHGGTASKTVNVALVDVPEVPDAPGAPRSGDRSLESLSINWTTPANTGPPINDYDVRYIPTTLDANVDANWTTLTHVGTTTTATITGLERGATYHFQVNAFNTERRSAWSPSGTFGTTPNTDPIFSSSVGLTISLPENTAGNTHIGNPYTATDGNNDTITYSISGTDDADFAINASNGQLATGINSQFDYEQPKKAYSITITAHDGKGGTATINVTINITDLEELPGQPEPIEFHNIFSTSMNLRWTEPVTPGTPEVTHYRVRYSQSETGPWTERTVAANIFELELTGLMPEQTYWAQVQAQNSDGWGTYSEVASQQLSANSTPIFDDTSLTINRSDTGELAGRYRRRRANLGHRRREHHPLLRANRHRRRLLRNQHSRRPTTHQNRHRLRLRGRQEHLPSTDTSHRRT